MSMAGLFPPKDGIIMLRCLVKKKKLYSKIVLKVRSGRDGANGRAGDGKYPMRMFVFGLLYKFQPCRLEL